MYSCHNVSAILYDANDVTEYLPGYKYSIQSSEIAALRAVLLFQAFYKQIRRIAKNLIRCLWQEV